MRVADAYPYMYGFDSQAVVHDTGLSEEQRCENLFSVAIDNGIAIRSSSWNMIIPSIGNKFFNL